MAEERQLLTRPMLAATVGELSQLRYPLYASPKLDGIRCIIMGGYAFTRAFKLVPNRHVQRALSSLPTGLDGELIAGDFNATQSAVMSEDGEPDFQYHVFDWFSEDTFLDRALALNALDHSHLRVVDQTLVSNEAELLAYETRCLQQGYEGVMLRDPHGPYKCGRSTLQEGWLLKFKRFKDSEARIVGFLEQMENTNDQEPDAFGYMKRPGGRAGHLPKDTLGSLLMEDVHTGAPVRAGSGLSDSQRQHIWDNKSDYIGRVVTYRYQELGPNGKPRFPRIVGFRAD